MPDTLIQAIHDASALRAPGMIVTPLTLSTALSASLGCTVHLKCDHLQSTGSFKYRGAANKIRVLDAASRARGVVSASSGNHGQALALAGPRCRYVGQRVGREHGVAGEDGGDQGVRR